MVKFINSSMGESEVFQELIKMASDKEKQIEELYGVDTKSDLTGKELIEEAHPEPFEAAPSYRENGGVVENGTEQQEEDIAVAERMPDNRVSRKKTAEDDLAEELLIIATEMKLRKHSDLESYANTIANKIQKKAFWGMAAAFAATAIIPLVTAWWFSSHSTSNDKINTGIDNNIAQLQEHLNAYVLTLSSEATGEELSGIRDRLNELNSFVVKVQATRNTYLKNSADLSNRLRDTTSVGTDKQPTASDVSKNVVTSQDNKPTLKQNSKQIIDVINKYNTRYSNYITNTVLPKLKDDLQYFTTYFKLTKNIEPVEKDKGWTDTVSSWFSSKPEIKKEGEVILQYLSMLVQSLEGDIQLRALDAKHTIDALSKKIEADISKEFENKEEQKPEETMAL